MFDLNAGLGEQKSIQANIGTSLNELNYNNNTQTLTEEIVGSLDPNDLLVSPNGIGSSHLIDPDTRLNYKVRFQNIGNYPASFVIVLDTLPEYLDLTSLELGVASHDFQFRILEGNILEWYFKNINLVDSLTNEAESHGFAQFSIKAKDGIKSGSQVLNRASIQFDYNPYIQTNTCLSTINFRDRTPDGFSLKIFPNPAINRIECYLVNDEIYAKGELLDRGSLRLDILSSIGNLMQTYYYESNKKVNYLDVSSLSPGLYFIRYEDSQGLVKAERFIKH